MASKKTHPHIQSPDDGQIRKVLEGRDAEIQDTYLAVHHLILETLPDVNFSIDTVDGFTGYGEHQYGYGGWGMASLIPARGWANLAIMRGVELQDPAGILEGTGKTMRGIKFRSPEIVAERADTVREYVLAASQLLSG